MNSFLNNFPCRFLMSKEYLTICCHNFNSFESHSPKFKN
jgi:hypothetical protein